MENSLEVFLEGEEFTHAKAVLRVEEGTEIVILDGSGKEYSAIVSKIEKHRLLAHITGVNAGEREPKTEIYLLCGLLKGDKTELVVQKATELGASKIGVFNSEYCSAYINDNKLERLNKVAREAAKQCLRSRAPRVEYFSSLEGALKSAKNFKNKLFACEFFKDGGMPNGLNGETAVVVGSEGGFSEKEFGLAQSLGFTGVTLGKRILRAETAAITMCALAAYALGELE
ncbi:MAG: 16S rRNA (uracil(1498)-N(3))-methyltransferase [Clostridia bacterium]|nr:16S rRNA (uracil(1498)-N(3))-methyltransferase [Clostridia bacterium]